MSHRPEIERDASGRPARLVYTRQVNQGGNSVVTPGSVAVGTILCAGCGVQFVPKRRGQRYHGPRCSDRAYNRLHPVSRQCVLPLEPPVQPVIPVRDQRVPGQERGRLSEMARRILERLGDGPVSNRELAGMFPPGAAWRTRLSDVRFYLRALRGGEEPIPHHDCGGGLVWYWSRW